MARCRKADVVAVLLGRGEFEIVVPPDTLNEITHFSRAARPPWLRNIGEMSWAGYALVKSGSYHGLWHWEKVEKRAGACKTDAWL